MKNSMILFVFILSCMMTVRVAAQDCNYYKLSEGMVLAYQNLDAKGKVTGTNRISCLNVKYVKDTIITRVRSEFTNVKSSKQSIHEYEMRCKDGKFFVDMQNFVDPGSMEGFKDMQVSVESRDMIYPDGLSEGQALPDASISMAAASGGMTVMNMTVNITNRKVIGKESVTVLAGTFDCYKITYDVETKMMFKFTTSVNEYISPGVGNVKTETFDKKGKLVGNVLLTELKR